MFRIAALFRRHHARLAGLPPAILACGCLLGSCGPSPDPEASDAARRTRDAGACAASISDRALQDFLALADKAAAGAEISLAEAVDLAETEAYRVWRLGHHPRPVDAELLGRHILVALAGSEALPDRERRGLDMDPVVLNFRETLQHRHLIGAFLDDFLRQDRICDVFTLLQDYLPAEELPDTLRLEFLASRPEIRYHDDTFQIDAGMAWAIGPTQLARALASIFYRMATSYELPSFTALQGPDLLMHTLRLVHHDAIPATIDRIDEKSFDVRHRGLAGWSVSEYALLSNAHHALKSLETSLPALLALEDPTAGDWSVFHRAFIRNNSTLAAGWFMARTIIDQLGWARLRAVGRSPADFFAAYLEAGALLPRHTDAPLHSEKWFLAHAPVPDEQTAAWIVAELRRRFG